MASKPNPITALQNILKTSHAEGLSYSLVGVAGQATTINFDVRN
jgi:hypothetical protein